MIIRTPCNQYHSNVQLWNKSARVVTLARVYCTQVPVSSSNI